MSKMKPLREQTLINDYVFSQIMRDPKRLKPLLECILGKKIRTIKIIERQKVLQEKYESKSVRLDLYIEDENGVVYDVEVQTTDQKNLGKRMRYYQGMMDISLFPRGTDYRKLKRSFVIFICNFDKYGQGRAIYTFQNWCDQDKRLLMGDRATKVVVNVTGWKDKSISPELREVLRYLDDGTIGSAYTQELDDAVQELIQNEERGHEYMLWMTYGAEKESLGEYKGKVKSIRKWLKKNGDDAVPSDEALDLIDVSLSTFNSVRSVINEHPDWDNEQVVDEADWEDDFDEE